MTERVLHKEKHEAVRAWLGDRFATVDGPEKAQDREVYKWAVEVNGERQLLYISREVYDDFAVEEITRAFDSCDAERALRAGRKPWLRTGRPNAPDALLVTDWPHD